MSEETIRGLHAQVVAQQLVLETLLTFAFQDLGPDMRWLVTDELRARGSRIRDASCRIWRPSIGPTSR